MIKYLLLTVSLATSAICFGQKKPNIDSLLKVADAEITDTAKAKIYNKVGNYYMDNNLGKAIEYFEKSKEIALRINNKLKAANNFYSIGFCYLRKADFEKSLYNYQQSTKIYEELKDTIRLSNALMSMGNVYFQSNDIPNTIQYYEKAGLLVEIKKDSIQLQIIYDTKGTIYDKLGKYDTAVFFLKRAITLAKKLNMNDMRYGSLSNLALTYKHQFKTSEALKCFDSVLVYFIETNQPDDSKAIVYNNIAATNVQAGNFAEAQIIFNKSIALCKSAGIPTVEMENYRNMADMYGKMKNFEQQAMFQKKYYDIKDSIFSVENKNQLTEQEASYQVEKKNVEIVKKDAEVIKQKSQRNILIIIALSILAVLAVVALFYSRIRNKNKLLEQKNIQINEQKDELQTLNQVKDRLFSIISHDLRNPLVTLRSYLSLADNDAVAPEKKQQFKLQTMNAVSQTSDMLDNLLAWANVQIKNTTASVVPLNIEDIVADEISNVQAQAYQKQITITPQLQVVLLPGDYDIISIALRNLLTNAIKYSNNNSCITITTIKSGGTVLLSVKDNGVGLYAAQIKQILTSQNDTTKGTEGEKGSGLGLFLVRELLQKMNATLSIESEPGKGSNFTIEIPAL